MQIKFEDLEKGDEIIIPSNSNLKYLKLVSKTKSGNWKCSISMKSKECDYSYTWRGNVHTYKRTKKFHLESDINKHDRFYYLDNKDDYIDMWLVKRE